jgi:hypothetical protein
MNRRQEMLRAAGNFANIADYHARSHGRALPPLPAPFIVVDQYSELLSQHPDFAELFVAIGLADLGAAGKRLWRAIDSTRATTQASMARPGAELMRFIRGGELFSRKGLRSNVFRALCLSHNKKGNRQAGRKPKPRRGNSILGLMSL